MCDAANEETLKNHKPTTVGEELFLVHLLRDRGDEASGHADHHKQGSRTVGEELWEIHNKRSRGRESERTDDARVEDGHSSDSSAKAELKEEKIGDGFCYANDRTIQKCPYNLRSMDAPKKN